jgi:glutathione S-transferase
MLKIWGRKNSINVQKVMWAVGELGIAHERVDAGGPFRGLDTEAFGAMNPNRRVPTIDDDGVVVWESNAIVRYLAAKHGAGSLWPVDPGERARSDMWMEWTTADLQPAFVGGVFWAFYRTPEPQRNCPAIRQGVARSSIATMSLRSTGRTCPMSKRGTRGSRNGPPIASTSWCRSTI